jgi:hypothetical protein
MGRIGHHASRWIGQGPAAEIGDAMELIAAAILAPPEPPHREHPCVLTQRPSRPDQRCRLDTARFVAASLPPTVAVRLATPVEPLILKQAARAPRRRSA